MKRRGSYKPIKSYYLSYLQVMKHTTFSKNLKLEAGAATVAENCKHVYVE